MDLLVFEFGNRWIEIRQCRALNWSCIQKRLGMKLIGVNRQGRPTMGSEDMRFSSREQLTRIDQLTKRAGADVLITAPSGSWQENKIFVRMAVLPPLSLVNFEQDCLFKKRVHLTIFLLMFFNQFCSDQLAMMRTTLHSTGRTHFLSRIQSLSL